MDSLREQAMQPVNVHWQALATVLFMPMLPQSAGKERSFHSTLISFSLSRTTTPAAAIPSHHAEMLDREQ
jgi:hypothetical protein